MVAVRPLVGWVFVVASLLCLTPVVHGERLPWRRRRRPGVMHNRMAAMRVSVEDWPAEPNSPKLVVASQFASALRRLCGWMPPGRATKYSNWILEYGAKFGEDPFLIGALIYRQGRCRANAEDLGGVGLSLLPSRMYRDGMRGGAYAFFVRENQSWKKKTKNTSLFGFFEGNLRRAQVNIYYTASLLSAWREQEPSIKDAFEHAPHRHYVSHWFWGDRIQSSRAEDRTFTDRRRLLYYYGATKRSAPIRKDGVFWHTPLDGAPRVVSSGLGFRRDSGARTHRGVDVESTLGEPVSAIADGKVIFSGVDLPGSKQNRNLSKASTNQFSKKKMGHGGRFVCIRHFRKDKPDFLSCYMHLNEVVVDAGDQVKGGSPIGFVGRTGMKTSAPHLHLELHTSEELHDASETLRGHLIGRPREYDSRGRLAKFQ